MFRLLLPPSEGKTAGGRGLPLRRREPTPGALGAARQATLAALAELIAGDPDAAARALLLPGGLAGEALADDARVCDSPTAPALRRYAGVLYDGLGFGSLSAREQRLAGTSVLIFSGLFGVVRGDEPVPLYRVPAKAVLPGIGVASTFWRPVLAEVLPRMLGSGLVVDLRSSDYAAMWRPRRSDAGRVVAVRVLSPTPRGVPAVISYTSKLGKGRLAAALVRRAAGGQHVADRDDIASAWLSCGGVDAVATARGGLDLYSA